jgi:hypothetical protein
LIERDGVINLVKTYFPDSDNETAARIADDVIHDVIPEIHAAVRRAIAKEKNKV